MDVKTQYILCKNKDIEVKQVASFQLDSELIIAVQFKVDGKHTVRDFYHQEGCLNYENPDFPDIKFNFNTGDFVGKPDAVISVFS